MVNNMFGILYSIATTIAAGFRSIELDNQSEYLRERCRKDNCTTYLDARGKTRMVDSNKIVNEFHLSNGDRVLKDKNGNIVKNYDKEKRDAEYNKRKSNGEYITVRRVPDLKAGGTWEKCYGKIFGNIFSDIENGRQYVIRRLPVKRCEYEIELFMDKYTGEFVRIADHSYMVNKLAKEMGRFYWTDEDIKNIINFYNNEVKKRLKNEDLLYRHGERAYYEEAYFNKYDVGINQTNILQCKDLAENRKTLEEIEKEQKVEKLDKWAKFYYNTGFSLEDAIFYAKRNNNEDNNI